MQGYIVIQHKISISKIHVLHIFTPKGVLVGQCGELSLLHINGSLSGPNVSIYIVFHIIYQN